MNAVCAVVEGMAVRRIATVDSGEAGEKLHDSQVGCLGGEKPVREGTPRGSKLVVLEMVTWWGI